MQTAPSDPPAPLPGVFGAAIQGRREEQQDSFRSVWLAGEQAWLLIVADGMGGHAAGGVASRIAVDTFVSRFTARRAEGATLEQALQSSLHDANSEITREQEAAPETSGMGTTLVAAHVSPQGLAWISVGDSPMWLFRKGAIDRVNEDHSFRPAVAKGARAIANMLQSVLNGDQIALIDCQATPSRLRKGDLVVVASDGLLTLTETEIAQAIRGSSEAGPEAVARALLKAVEERAKSNQDNCTVLVASAPGSGADEARTGARWIAAIAIVVVALASLAGYLHWRHP